MNTHWRDILTEAQLEWLLSEVNNKNILTLQVHGSHLYGLEREGSDVDIKGVYLPNLEEVFLGNNNNSIHIKNEELNIEVELKSAQSFLRSAKKCDTNCIDMLHTPKRLQIHRSFTWSKLQGHKSDLYAKDMKGLIGYIKTHSKKYTNKIDRFKEIEELYNYSKNSELQEADVQTLAESLCFTGDFKYVKSVTDVSDHEQEFLEVCGKKYLYKSSVKSLQTSLEKEMNRYGERTSKGVEVGIDTKSLSHALRVLYQLKEILITGDLVFPLENADKVLEIKSGENTNLVGILDDIDTLYEECMMLLEECNLQTKPNIDNMLKWVIDSTLIVNKML